MQLIVCHTHTRTNERTHARTHARTHTRTHARTIPSRPCGSHVLTEWQPGLRVVFYNSLVSVVCIKLLSPVLSVVFWYYVICAVMPSTHSLVTPTIGFLNFLLPLSYPHTLHTLSSAASYQVQGFATRPVPDENAACHNGYTQHHLVGGVLDLSVRL